MTSFTAVVYGHVADTLEDGTHWKLMSKQKTGSKRDLVQLIFEQVNTGGRPKE